MLHRKLTSDIVIGLDEGICRVAVLPTCHYKVSSQYMSRYKLNTIIY